MPSKRLTVRERKEVFESLVALQDEGTMSVSDSLEQISNEYGITVHQVRQIQDEGIDKEWPPFDEAVTSQK